MGKKNIKKKKKKFSGYFHDRREFLSILISILIFTGEGRMYVYVELILYIFNPSIARVIFPFFLFFFPLLIRRSAD